VKGAKLSNSRHLYHFVFVQDATFIFVEQIENFIHSKHFQGATLGNLFVYENKRKSRAKKGSMLINFEFMISLTR